MDNLSELVQKCQTFLQEHPNVTLTPEEKYNFEEIELLVKRDESMNRIIESQDKQIKLKDQQIEEKNTKIYLRLQFMFLQKVHPDFDS
jgi:hypothetical protein